ncbi:MAG: phage Gp37/Gp68 family protein [Rhodospirillales bacterium]|nr:phage Gp37/Gp68 family protein [Rhodospirillales bacterium]
MTKIEWTQRPGTIGVSWNPIRARNQITGGLGHFCEHVSEGCRNCYAERMQPRFWNRIRYAAQDRDKVEIFLDEAVLRAPLKWRKPRTVFVCSMTDLYGDWVTDEWLDRIKAVQALTPQHTYIELTKRPERMRDNLAAAWTRDRWEAVLDLGADVCKGYHPGPPRDWPWPIPNVWLGVSAEDQARADERIPLLLDTPGAVRFVSYEPALGPVDFRGLLARCPVHDFRGGFCVQDCGNWQWLHWIIAGGESGPGARPAHPDWFRSIRDQCAAAGVPYFHKQNGEWLAWEPDSPPLWRSQNGQVEDRHCLFPADFDKSSEWDDGLSFVAHGESHAAFQRVGKKAAGRTLDGREHDEWPGTDDA